MSNGRPRSTFYWAMRLMPAHRREAMFALYDLARALDDVADEPGSRASKHDALDEWRREIDRLYSGAPSHALTRALLPALRRFDLPREEFIELVNGMLMDADGPLVAPDRSVLDLYCRRVAGTIGRLSLPIFGADGPEEREFALHLGRALQLTNILRDLQADAAIGRLYVPAEYLAGITDHDPPAVIRHPRFNDAAQRLLGDAREAYAAAESCLPRCNRRALWPALAMRAAYRGVLDRLARTNLPAPSRVSGSRFAAFTAALRAAIFASA